MSEKLPMSFSEIISIPSQSKDIFLFWFSVNILMKISIGGVITKKNIMNTSWDEYFDNRISQSFI